MINWLNTARKRGCPLLAIETPEPLGALDALRTDSVQRERLAWAWDCATGLTALTTCAEEYGVGEHCCEPDIMLTWASTVPSDALIAAQWFPEYWQDVRVRQGVMNVRDTYKANGRTLVLLGRQLSIPASVQSDFMLYTQTLPGTAELESVVQDIEALLPLKLPDSERAAAIDALRGMTRFEAEQHAAMSYLAASDCSHEAKGMIRVPELWKAKIQLINNTPGLSYWQGNESPANLVGLDGVLSYLQEEAQGRQPIRLILWCDESEDTFAGAEGDTSGISQDYLGRIAGHMVDTEARGMSLFGHPGTGKSHTAKAAGQIFRCPVLALDMGAMKGSLVGESESNLRHALSVERAIVGNQKGTTLWLWTTNAIEKIPNKIRSRSQPEWFYDLPGEQEQLPIWALYQKQYELESQPFPNFEGWTGREIRQCCFEAWNKRTTLVHAARYVVPSCVSQRKQIDERRKQASGRYLDASKGGVFTWQESQQGRKVEV